MANIFSNALEQITDDTVTTIVTGDTNASLIIQLDICNTHTAEISVDVTITRSGTDYYFIKDVPIPVGSTLQCIAGQKILLLLDDVLKVTLGHTDYSCDVICGLLTEVNA